MSQQPQPNLAFEVIAAGVIKGLCTQVLDLDFREPLAFEVAGRSLAEAITAAARVLAERDAARFEEVLAQMERQISGGVA